MILAPDNKQDITKIKFMLVLPTIR